MNTEFQSFIDLIQRKVHTIVTISLPQHVLCEDYRLTVAHGYHCLPTGFPFYCKCRASFQVQNAGRHGYHDHPQCQWTMRTRFEVCSGGDRRWEHILRCLRSTAGLSLFAASCPVALRQLCNMSMYVHMHMVFRSCVEIPFALVIARQAQGAYTRNFETCLGIW